MQKKPYAGKYEHFLHALHLLNFYYSHLHREKAQRTLLFFRSQHDGHYSQGCGRKEALPRTHQR